MKIYIKGFKSIKSAQEVELGNKLTFLVGPNSAGKSVVMLALQKLKGDDPSFILDQTQIYRNPNRNSEICGVHALGVEWKYESQTLSFFAIYCADEILVKKSNLNMEFNLHRISEMITTEQFEQSDPKFFREQFRNGIPLISIGGLKTTERQLRSDKNISRLTLLFRGSETILINYKDEIEETVKKIKEASKWYLLLLESITASSVEEIKQLSLDESQQNAENIKTLIKNIGYFNKEIEVHTDLLKNGIISWTPDYIKDILKISLKGKDRQRMLNIFEKLNSYIEKFIRNKNEIYAKSYPGKQLDIALVSADRSLPIENLLSAKIKIYESKNSYQELMESQVIKEWGGILPGVFRGEGDFRKQQSYLIDLVNRALSENLFIDNAYRINVETKYLAVKSTWDEKSIDETEPEFDCKISLQDSHGRNLKFEDVGSGIGYVIPVLIESFSTSNIDKVVFIQQPELHLHPALQASLTDVLIEASANKKIVAETHSEHMILRALKRVRQTTNGMLKDPELKLKPEDIAVNYFEPLPDGSTKVHILRVTDDGDFLDRWPNGFFAERDQELFDE